MGLIEETPIRWIGRNEYEQSTMHYYFIHNVIGSLIRGIADSLAFELYPRTTEVVIGTYDKAIQHSDKKN